MGRSVLYTMTAVVLLSAIIGAYRISTYGMRLSPCPSCGRPMHVVSAETGMRHTCNGCIYKESFPATGAFSWGDTGECVVTDLLDQQ